MSYEYLEHHGILGQKWGVRRYQNPDGSYTAEGRKRHAADSESTGSKIKSGLKKAQHIADKATIIRAKTKVGSTDTYDKATKGPMGTNKSRRQADYEADHGVNGSYSRQYTEGKKVREAEKREKDYNSEKLSQKIDKAGDFYENHKSSIKKGAAIGAIALGTLSAVQTANNYNTANALIEGYAKIPMKTALKMGAVAAGSAAVKGALAGGTAVAVKNRYGEKRQPWDEKPNNRPAWDEKPDKSRKGNI